MVLLVIAFVSSCPHKAVGIMASRFLQSTPALRIAVAPMELCCYSFPRRSNPQTPLKYTLQFEAGSALILSSSFVNILLKFLQGHNVHLDPQGGSSMKKRELVTATVSDLLCWGKPLHTDLYGPV